MQLGSKVIIGNWKMYKTVEEALHFVEALLPELTSFQEPLLLAVPFTALWPLREKCQGSTLLLGAQNMASAEEGAFTGEIAARMLKEAGASFVLLGHSERRRLFGETDLMVRKKLERAEQAGLLPILCIGESLQERMEGRAEEVLKLQLQTLLEGIQLGEEPLYIAYEPLWAVGTGLPATLEMIEAAHELIKKEAEIFLGKEPKVIYGGSVTPKNASSLLSSERVDGLLVGGASLHLESFLAIAQNSRLSE